MKITAVKIRLLENSGNKLKAICYITLDDMFVLRDIRLLNSNGRFFLAMPSTKKPNGAFQDIFHPINERVRASLESIVFYLYNVSMERHTSVQEYKYSGQENVSLLTQTPSDFTPQENSNHGSYLGKDLQNAIDSWLSE